MAIDEEQSRLAQYLDGLSIQEHQPRQGETLITQEHRVREMLDVVLHASECCSPDCDYRNCPKAKGLLYHGFTCETRGCHLCKKMWCLVQLHARACQQSNCRVPHCRSVKLVYQQQQQQHSDSPREATGTS